MKPQTTNPASPTIGVEEAAEILRCGVRAAQALIDRGELPALEINQRSTVLLREDVIEYVRIQARRQAQERKAEHARKSGPPRSPKAPDANQPTVRIGRGRQRRPLPDLTPYEIAAGIRPK